MPIRAVAVWYRFENYLESAGVDEFDNSLGPPRVRVHLREFEVERETPKGVWLRGFMFRRFCLRGARKQFACPTLEGALESFLARKRKQASIYERRLGHIQQACMAAVDRVEEANRRQFGRTILNSWI